MFERQTAAFTLRGRQEVERAPAGQAKRAVEPNQAAAGKAARRQQQIEKPAPAA